jgi:hypothetical protein
MGHLEWAGVEEWGRLPAHPAERTGMGTLPRDRVRGGVVARGSGGPTWLRPAGSSGCKSRTVKAQPATPGKKRGVFTQVEEWTYTFPATSLPHRPAVCVIRCGETGEVCVHSPRRSRVERAAGPMRGYDAPAEGDEARPGPGRKRRPRVVSWRWLRCDRCTRGDIWQHWRRSRPRSVWPAARP